MSVLVKKSGPRPLPSAAFYALAQPKIELSEIRVIARALRAGAWTLDGNEIDPETGLSFLQTVVRNQIKQHDDDATLALIDLAVAQGADLTTVAPDGLSVLGWAQKNNLWPIAKHLESHGAKTSGTLTSAQMEAYRTINDNPMNDQWRMRENTRAFIDSFGGPDVLVAHQPLALVAARQHLHLNSYGLSPTTPKADYAKALEKSSKAWREMGEEALVAQSNCDTALWAWMGMAVTSAHSGGRLEEVTPSQRSRLTSSWRAYEKTLFKARFPHIKQPAQQAQAMMDALLEMVPRVLQGMTQQPTRLDNKIQSTTAWTLQALRCWQERLSGEGEESKPLIGAIEPGIWRMAAKLFDALPQALWSDPSFTSGWTSAGHYHLFYPLQAYCKHQRILPAFVERPWVTLAPLLKEQPQLPDPFVAQALEWLASVPVDPEDTKLQRFLETVDGNLLAAWRQQHLTTSLSESTPATSRAPRF